MFQKKWDIWRKGAWQAVRASLGHSHTLLSLKSRDERRSSVTELYGRGKVTTPAIYTSAFHNDFHLQFAHSSVRI